MEQQLLWRGAWRLQLSKIYAHIYPLWDIAFDRIFGYTDSVEVLLISAPHMSVAISSGYV